MHGELVDLLLMRLRAVSSKRALQDLLRTVNQEQQHSLGRLRVTGNKDNLLDGIRAGIDRQILTVARLASLVDRLEENGGQHIFLFDLTEEGIDALRTQAFRQAFATMPSGPTPLMYSDTPAQPQTYFSERPEGLVVKKIHTVHFWEKDESRSYSDEYERATIQVRRSKRAIDLFKVNPELRQAEIRISKTTSGIDDKSAGERFQVFTQTLSPLVDIDGHLQSTPIWDGFSTIVRTRDGTFMSIDDAHDPSIRITISNRRTGWHTKDVRDHPTYKYADTNYVRKHLNIYWDTEGLATLQTGPAQGDPERVHTVLSKFVLGQRAYGKVYVAATVSPEVLSGVTERVRRFAQKSS